MYTAGIGVVVDNKEHFSAWHQFLLVCSLPSLAAIIGLVFLPESPRYLLEAGREVEAMMVYQVTNSLVVQPKGSTLLVPNPATGHDLNPVPSTFHPHNLFS
jgi:hypothetical protein